MLFFLIFLVAGAMAATKADLGAKGVKLGVTFLNAAQMANLAGCMETPVYNQENIDSLKSSALGCAADPRNVPYLKYLTGMGILADFDKCLKPINENWSELLDKVIPVAMKIINPIACKLNNTLTTWKKNKKAKAKCIADGYGLILKELTRPQIDKICKQLVKNALNEVEWTCTLQVGKKILDFSNYTCPTIKVGTATGK